MKILKMLVVLLALVVLNTSAFGQQWDGEHNPIDNIFRTGNVGIGTKNPLSKLSVGGDGFAYTTVHANHKSSGNFGYLGGLYYASYGKHAGSQNYGYLGSAYYGVYGVHYHNLNYGYIGSTDFGAYGRNHHTGNYGYLGSTDYGVYGRRGSSGNFGYLGSTDYGAYGRHSGNFGFLGSTKYGAYGYKSGSRNFGYLASTDYGAYGNHYFSLNFGYLGGENYGVYGRRGYNGNYGYLGSPSVGAHGYHKSSGNYGNLGSTSVGAHGYHKSSGNYGNLGSTDYGALGRHESSGNLGVLGSLNCGVYGSTRNSADYAGFFRGKVEITGNLSKGGGWFKIDHPLDPENKYLHHSFVESPDMMNVYNGNITLDENGQAIVQLPDYFEALNRDFRYQLTPIGAPGPNLYIAEKISDNRFKIAGGKSGMEVSWQVTGIRHDPYAVANRIRVEEDKPAEECGYYLHPNAYGFSEEKSIERAQNLWPSHVQEVAQKELSFEKSKLYD